MKQGIFLILFFWLCLFSSLKAQSTYWVVLTDKAESLSLAPEEVLSPKAIQNRQIRGISIDKKDYPVSQAYQAQLREMGIEIRYASRWFNAVAAPLTTAQLSQVQSLPFVKKIQPVAFYATTAKEDEILCDDVGFRGTAVRQLDMLEVDNLHQAGFDGEGVTIAVFDNGFDKVDSLPGFQHLFSQEKIIATYDFVDGDEDVFHGCSHCRHGTYVFSIISASMPGRLTGAAPGANYILLRTENDDSETPQEEINWIAAAEMADSLGAQILTTSLGYSNFDGLANDYSAADFDGNTPLITRGADIAASRGMLVINSAGNNGRSGSYAGINAPADGDSVLAIGSVNECEVYSAFSSRGPRVDGAVKPDLTAMGEETYFLHPDGSVRIGNGTSFSCPLVTGLAACLIEAFPDAGGVELAEILRKSGDRYANPTDQHGYGIPKASLAWELLQQTYPNAQANKAFPNEEFVSPFFNSSLILFPNPSAGDISLSMDFLEGTQELMIRWIDIAGREVLAYNLIAEEGLLPLRLNVPTSSGMYMVEVRTAAEGGRTWMEKVMIARP